jgi:ATP-dependent Clp protease adaptor protein ClpS
LSSQQRPPEIVVKPREKKKKRTRRVPPYHVILENDDFHSQDFVIGVLQKALGYAHERAYQLMMQAHTTGRSAVWTGPKEVAELKADQIRSFHETVDQGGAKLGPLTCFIEPAPSSE